MLNLPFKLSNLDALYANNENGLSGYYPMGEGNFWHSGIHINYTSKETISPIVPGCVVAYRISKEYKKIALPESLSAADYRGLSSQDKWKYSVDRKSRTGIYKLNTVLPEAAKSREVSNNFVLLKHVYAPSQLNDKEFVFYSLYMNLAPISETGSTYYGSDFKTDGSLNVLDKDKVFYTDKIGIPGLGDGTRYIDFAIITEKSLFDYKEKAFLSKNEKNFVFYELPGDVKIYSRKKRSITSKKYYIPSKSTYEIIDECSCDNKIAKKIRIKSMAFYLLSNGMGYEGKKTFFSEGDSCRITNIDTVWMGTEKLDFLKDSVSDSCRYVYDKIRNSRKNLLNRKHTVVGIIEDQPAILVDFQKDCPCIIEFWVEEDSGLFSDGVPVGSSKEFTVYEENPLICDFLDIENTEGINEKIKGITQQIYCGEGSRKYRKVRDYEYYIEESKVESCMKSAFDWDVFFDNYTEPVGESEDILCDRTELLKKVDASGFIDNFLNGRRLTKEELQRIYGGGEKFEQAGKIRKEMRRVVCKHPLEWDKEKFTNIKKSYDEKSFCGKMPQEQADNLAKIAEAIDLWKDGLSKLFMTNNLNFVHPVYFLHHLDKANVFEMNPYLGMTLTPVFKGPAIKVKSNPGFAPVYDGERSSGVKEHFPDSLQDPTNPRRHWATLNCVFGYSNGYTDDDGKKKFHTGIDLAGYVGTPIISFIEGEVWARTKHDAYGNVMIIKNANDNKLYLLAHLSQYVASGTIRPGDVVAKVGNTGAASQGAHLHLEVFICDFTIRKQVLNEAKNKEGDGEGTVLDWTEGFNNIRNGNRRNPLDHSRTKD